MRFGHWAETHNCRGGGGIIGALGRIHHTPGEDGQVWRPRSVDGASGAPYPLPILGERQRGRANSACVHPEATTRTTSATQVMMNNRSPLGAMADTHPLADKWIESE